ncbi:hypothetical protein EGW08_017253 [Elysia chlorotica]|uniref:Fibrinogen C-terminal domain-containing protein n=1 Tax=Elysia chlorotica TaxID=188477 RepID=A0A433T0A5_ELYCH|nr:hypothetical protein EGW08_017253 [Elysia chlorotica]
MDSRLFFTVALCLLQVTWGLQFTLDRDMISTQGGRPACGVLSCVQRGHDSSSTTPSPQIDDGNYSTPVSTVTRMAIYKTDPDSPGAQRDSRKPFLVASVNSQQPRVSRVANAIKVDGRLETSTASIRLELFKQEDCRAEFTCQLVAVDAQGRELVRTSHLLQQPSSSASHSAGGQGWTPAVVMHLVDLAQDLNTNMQLMRSAMDDFRDRLGGVEDKVAASENGLSGGLRNLENRMEDKMERLEDKFDSLEDKFKRLEDKTVSTEVNVLQKMDERNVFDKAFANKIDSLEDKLEKWVAAQSKADCSQTLSNLTSKLNALPSSVKTYVEDSFEAFKREAREQDYLLNETLRAPLAQIIQNSTTFVVSKINDRVDRFYDRLEEHFAQLSSSINESVIHTRSSFRDTVTAMNISDANEVAAVVRDILTPKTCSKGMISLLTQPSYPYPVVKPSSGDIPAVPYLCDTVTDAGGWIIIQRRTTGNVDFYRNWADYKKGFGTFDDDFWLGNDNIHAITSSGLYELRVDLRYNGKAAFAHYDTFYIADEVHLYALTLGSYHGTAGDALSGHNGRPFTTLDRDNDSYGRNCAVDFTGAWWYGGCHSSNLNGKWKAGANKGPRWSTFSSDNAVSFSEMKIRKK